jgi:hypothetical protein
MGPDKDSSARIRRSTEHIAHAVHRRLQAGFLHPIKKPLTRCHILGRKGRTHDTGAMFPDGPEMSQVIHEALGIDFRHEFHSSVF